MVLASTPRRCNSALAASRASGSQSSGRLNICNNWSFGFSAICSARFWGAFIGNARLRSSSPMAALPNHSNCQRTRRGRRSVQRLVRPVSDVRADVQSSPPAPRLLPSPQAVLGRATTTRSVTSQPAPPKSRLPTAAGMRPELPSPSWHVSGALVSGGHLLEFS